MPNPVSQNCLWCDGKGIVFAELREVDTGDYAFRCKCPWSRKPWLQSFPEWDNRFSSKFKVKFLNEPNVKKQEEQKEDEEIPF